jgi:hypothetical protein
MGRGLPCPVMPIIAACGRLRRSLTLGYACYVRYTIGDAHGDRPT